MDLYYVASLIEMCAVKQPELAKINEYICANRLTAEAVTYAAIKICEKGAFERTEFEWINGREPNEDELLTGNWVALFDVFIKHGLDANMVFTEDSEYDNIMWELRNLQNGDIGPTVLRNLLQKGGDPNIKIDGLSFFEYVDHDVLFDVEEQEDKRLFDIQFRFWLVLMGFGGYINDHQCPVKMAEGHDQSIFKDFEKFDYRIEYGQSDWTMRIFCKETGAEVATL